MMMAPERKCCLMCLLAFLIVPVFVSGAFVGVNVGTAMSQRPKAEEIVRLLKSQSISHVRLLDADHELLKALAGTGIQVTVGVPNDELLGVGGSRAAAADWINRNVAAYIPATNITAVAVGSEVLTTLPNATLVLYPAMSFIHAALLASNLDSQVKVSTPHAVDVIVQPFPPSTAVFNSTMLPTLFPILRFLQDTKSFFMLNAHPYYAYLRAGGIFPLDYALSRPLPPVKQIVDPNTLLRYTGMFDAMVDAAFYSMTAANFSDIPIVVTESGWPWQGGPGESDATVDNAIAYNTNLIQRILNDTGTPSRPGTGVGTYIYELFNEDLKTGIAPARNWGVYFANGTSVYSLRMGNGVLTSGTSGTETSPVFCLVKAGADQSELKKALDWACGPGLANCTAIQAGGACYIPNTIQAHASYAFNDYYHKTVNSGGTCFFNGTASLSSSDPSSGNCVYLGSAGSPGGGSAMGPAAAGGPSGVNGGDSGFMGGADRLVGLMLLWMTVWVLVHLV